MMRRRFAAIANCVASLAPKGWLVIGALALLIAGVAAVVRIANNRDERLIETAEQAGASKATVDGHNRTLDQLGDANHAERELEADGERSAARHAECLRDSRRKPACERYRPLTQ